MKSGAKYIDIISWNDFEEDTDITPSNSKGDALLTVFAFYNKWFKTGKLPEIDRSLIVFAYPERIPDKIKTSSPAWGTQYHSPPFTPKLFYWASLTKPVDLELVDGSRVKLSQGVSLGELPLPGPGNYRVMCGGKYFNLKEIKRTGIESQRAGEGGLEHQYQKIFLDDGK